MRYKVQCLKVFCYHGNKSTILLLISIFRATAEVSSKLYFVEISQVSEKLWLFNHKRADFWLPNFGFKRSLLSLLSSKEGDFINGLFSKFFFSLLCKIILQKVDKMLSIDIEAFDWIQLSHGYTCNLSPTILFKFGDSYLIA